MIEKAQKAKNPRREWNEDIDWLLNYAPGLLGEKGSSQDPSGGGGPRYISDTGPYHSRAMAAIPHVARWRRLNAIWTRCEAHHRSVLEERYRPRRRTLFPGASVFGDLTGVAAYSVISFTDARESIRKALSDPHNPKHTEAVAKALEVTRRANREAHLEWERIELLLASRADAFEGANA